MSETKTETPLEHFGAWTRTAEADGIGKFQFRPTQCYH